MTLIDEVVVVNCEKGERWIEDAGGIHYSHRTPILSLPRDQKKNPTNNRGAALKDTAIQVPNMSSTKTVYDVQRLARPSQALKVL